MQKCSICEKPIYGHPQAKEGQKIVCGSCPLNKMQGGPSGKSVFTVQIALSKMAVNQKLVKQENVMSSDLMKVRSNVRNKTILLGGRFPLVFDEDGVGRMPAHLLPMLEVEQRMKPGRYTLEPAEPTVEPVVEMPLEEPAPVVEVLALPEEPLPAGADQSFLANTEKPKKASKK